MKEINVVKVTEETKVKVEGYTVQVPDYAEKMQELNNLKAQSVASAELREKTVKSAADNILDMVALYIHELMKPIFEAGLSCKGLKFANGCFILSCLHLSKYRDTEDVVFYPYSNSFEIYTTPNGYYGVNKIMSENSDTFKQDVIRLAKDWSAEWSGMSSYGLKELINETLRKFVNEHRQKTINSVNSSNSDIEALINFKL